MTTPADARVRESGAGLLHMDMLAPGIHCGGCVSRIERSLMAHPAVTGARVNLSTRRIAVDWRPGAATADDIIGIVAGLGFEAQPITAEVVADAGKVSGGAGLLRAMAVAGFAASNVMLLSVSVWSGADEATRTLFHWISALIALPAVTYAGQPFFRSAYAALKARAMNMDVPISLAVILATALSVVQTVRHAEHAFFDAAVMLLFFLLVGRYLDHMMRDRARSAVTQLLSLSARTATVIREDGSREHVSVGAIETGMLVAVPAGERVPVDGVIAEGTSEVDRSMVTGESVPEAVGAGDMVHSGTMNLSGALKVRVTATGEDTLLADVVRMMEAAEQGKARYVRLADRVARLYAPAVHVLAGLTFTGWLAATGGDAYAAIMAAIAVLIITCPCALALAVPAVQIVASGLLFRRGILLKDGAGLEKLAAIDTVVFDKTGTLTLGRPVLVEPVAISTGMLAIAAGLARESRHPLSRAVAQAARERGIAAEAVHAVREVAGEGLQGTSVEGELVRLGSRRWCGVLQGAAPGGDALELFLKIGIRDAVALRFSDRLRPEAAEVVAGLRQRGIDTEILSGDREEAVEAVADAVGIFRYEGGQTPQAKLAHINRLAAQGRKVLMVGDGINDAPALAAGHASMAPSSASDIGRTAADFVFTSESLTAVLDAVDIARRTRRMVTQNFLLAIGYNIVAVPVAMAGLVTPLIAALAMSSSSLIVTGNALRLRLMHLGPASPNAAAQETDSADAGSRPLRSAA
ncbi:heavy metal translocating P-type ATPase [Iodidimonas sp. SYSU 1G8]|uniref:heavy metal translocating P-type ATPase n=1 Tax=Iodidimonas sp. SYSU 1G8 TaxID=3133967 RepID=UPI0031FF32F9